MQDVVASRPVAALTDSQFCAILVGYTAARLRAYQTPGDRPLYERTIAQSAREQTQLWSLGSSDLRADQTNLGLSLLLEPLNQTD
jgi:hypothetical protein